MSTLRDSAVDNARIAFSKTHLFKGFLIASLLFSLAEPVLVGFEPVGTAFILQIVVLTISSVIFVAGFILTGAYYEQNDGKILSRNEILLAMFDGEVVFELFFLVFGWAYIFEAPRLLL